MATLEEDAQSRATYGDAPGWSERMRSVAPTAQGGANPGASPTPDEPPASLAEVGQEPAAGSEPATPPSSPPAETPDGEVPFHQHPRWIERQQELERLRQERDEFRRLAETAVQRIAPPTPPTPTPDDPWKGLTDHGDPATAQFWQQQQRLFQHEARRMVDQQQQAVLQTVNAGRQELAAIKIAQFRQANPEITSGSPEERQIAGYVSQGYDLDTAKKLTLYDKLEAENRVFKTKQASVTQRRAASASESGSGIPQTAGLPPKPGDWRERASAVLDAGGDMTDAAAAVFGPYRRRTP